MVLKQKPGADCPGFLFAIGNCSGEHVFCDAYYSKSCDAETNTQGLHAMAGYVKRLIAISLY